MKPLNQITPEDVEAAYREHGLKPIAAHLVAVNGCCCAIGALCYSEIQAAGLYWRINYKMINDALACSDDERLDLEDGFDRSFSGSIKAHVPPGVSSYYQAGWKVGQHMRKLADEGKI